MKQIFENVDNCQSWVMGTWGIIDRLYSCVCLRIYILKILEKKQSVGEQNLPPQNVSLRHEYYFRLIIFKKQTTQKVFIFTPPLAA